MTEISSARSADELYAGIQAVAAGTPYRMCRTERGFDLTVDVDVPQWQELLTRHRVGQVHTYRVALRPQKKVYTLTDVVRTVEYGAGPGEVRLGATAFVGRTVSVSSHRTVDGSEQYTFSSAEGHRLIRGVTEELGWREAQPASVKIALGFAALGGVGGLVAVIVLAVTKWL
ncbi:hypothetical protein [Streptomyces sp. NPDC048650]|uniref:hypothetical protein n=1 Tax=unclassified Streptomyces TaxID=2593676 RepID=UPI003723A70E